MGALCPQLTDLILNFCICGWFWVFIICQKVAADVFGLLFVVLAGFRSCLCVFLAGFRLFFWFLVFGFVLTFRKCMQVHTNWEIYQARQIFLSTRLGILSRQHSFLIIHFLSHSKNDGLTYEPITDAIKNADIRNTFGIVKSETNPLKVQYALKRINIVKSWPGLR